MAFVEATAAGEEVPLDQIETELARLFVGRQEPGEAGAVRRARMSNLVIFGAGAERIAEAQAAIPNIVAVHPARVLLAMHQDQDEEGPVTGRVNAWCSVASGTNHICCEQITLTSHGRVGDHLVFAVRELIIGDLPTNLWWASSTPPALAGPNLREAAEQTQQIIYDSNGWPDPARGVAATAAWIAATERGHETGETWRVVSDVNWRRLKFWRRLIAQTLDPNAAPGALDSIAEVQIEHGPHAVVQAWLIVSWLASRLGWEVEEGKVQPGVEICWRARAPHGPLTIRIKRLADGPADVRRLRIRCVMDGKPIGFSCSEVEPGRLAAVTEGIDTAPRTMTTQPQPLDDLIAKQLSDRERDTVFRDALVVAERFARSVL
ncbi:MAG: glucose-6-phosphate dehydrogenase assembly protein OpcA [Gemmataceae bacterium]